MVLAETVPEVTQALPLQYCTVPPASERPELVQVALVDRAVSMLKRFTVLALVQPYSIHAEPGELSADTQWNFCVEHDASR